MFSTSDIVKSPKIARHTLLKAYVLLKFPSPECPPDAICEASIGDHIVVGDKAKSLDQQKYLEAAVMAPDETVLFGAIDGLVVGKLYKFELAMNGSHWTPSTSMGMHQMRELKIYSAQEIQPESESTVRKTPASN